MEREKVTIVFVLNNGQPNVTKEYSHSSTDRFLSPATYSGYEFLNWSWNGKPYSSDTIDDDFIDANAGKTLKFVANWNEKVYQILNGSTEVGYASTLNDAIDSAQTGYTIKLLKNRTDNSEASINGKSLTFDSNGYTLKRDSVISISSNATLTFDGTGTIESSSSDEAIYNEGTLNFKNGTLKASQHAIISSGTAVTNIKGRTIYSGNKETIILKSSGTTTITGGDVKSCSSWSLGNEGTGTVNISNVNWGGYGPSVYIDGTGKITITNSTITSTSSNALINSGGTMVISNSTIKNEDKYNSTKNTIYVYGNSTTTIDNSNVICYQAAHVIANLGKLNISDSHVYSYSSPKKNGIINANSSAKTVITNVYFLDSIYPSGTTISSKTITSASSVSYKNKKSNSNNFLIFNYNSTNYGMSL